MARHSRRRTRVSRPLIAALGVTMIVGGSVYVHNERKSQAAGLRRIDSPSASQASPAAANASLASASIPLQDTPLQLAAIDTTPLPPPGAHGLSADVQPSKPMVQLAALVTQTPIGTTGAAASATTQPTRPATQPAASALRTLGAAGGPVVPTRVSASEGAGDTKQQLSAVLHRSLGHWRPRPRFAWPAPRQLRARTFWPMRRQTCRRRSAGRTGALNDALAGGHLKGADADAARKSLGDINQTVLFSKKRFKDDPFQTLYQIQSGDRLARIADRHNVTWELLCRINALPDPRKIRPGQWIKIPNGPFHCVITKAAYRMDLYLGSPGEAGSLFVASFPVGLGKDNSTPTGLWMVQQGAKAHPATYYSPRGEGVIPADDPENPLGGYWIGLSGLSGNAVEKNSYGIHGTIEPDSIGKQASMGCIRLGHDDIAFLYDVLIDGKSKVLVKE